MIRVPRIQGLPWQTAGSRVMRSFQVIQARSDVEYSEPRQRDASRTAEAAIPVGPRCAHEVPADSPRSPPHFHARYGDYEISVRIEDGLVEGRFPRRALAHLLEWYQMHRGELADNWELARAGD